MIEGDMKGSVRNIDVKISGICTSKNKRDRIQKSDAPGGEENELDRKLKIKLVSKCNEA